MHHIEDASAVERALIDRASRARAPINGSIELTPLCNMNCDMCYVRLSRAEMERQGRLRTVGEWLEIARQMQQAGTLFLLLTGGEPLTYPDFRRLYLGLQRLGMMLTINTNGTLIDEDWAAFFGSHKPRRINVTLYGADEQAYAGMCHYPEGFDRTLRGIRLLREHDVDVRISISVTPANAGEFGRIQKIADDLGVPTLVDTYMVPAVRERMLPFDQQSRLEPEQAARVRVAAFKRRMPPKRFAQFIFENIWAAQHMLPDQQPRKMTCLAGSCSFTVNWQGMLRPCVVLSEPSINLLSTDFETAWAQLRAELDKITLSPICGACTLRALCSNCAASALLETGRYDGVPEYLCRYTRETLRLLIDEAAALREAAATPPVP